MALRKLTPNNSALWHGWTSSWVAVETRYKRLMLFKMKNLFIKARHFYRCRRSWPVEQVWCHRWAKVWKPLFLSYFSSTCRLLFFHTLKFFVCRQKKRSASWTVCTERVFRARNKCCRLHLLNFKLPAIKYFVSTILYN